MIGETWNVLAVAPTDRELDAALAEVRVRAMAHQGRRARIHSARSGVIAAVLVGVGFMGGRTVGGGVRFYDTWRPWMARAQDAAVAVVEPGAVAAEMPLAPGLQRWHVHAATELDGQIISQGDGWVEGPPGTGLTLSTGYEHNGFSGTVMPSIEGDSVTLRVAGALMHSLGKTARGGDVTERIWVNRRIAVKLGTRVTIYPFGRARTAEGALTTLTIEGPGAPAPAGPVQWLPLTGRTFMRQADSLALQHGVRYADRNVGAIDVKGTWYPRARAIRASLPGHRAGPWTRALYYPWEPITVPGAATQLYFVQYAYLREGEAVCYRIGVRDPASRGSNIPSFRATEACFTSAAPAGPITVTIPGFGPVVLERQP